MASPKHLLHIGIDQLGGGIEAHRMAGAGVHHALDAEFVDRLVQVVQAEDVGVHDRQEGAFHRDAAEMQDGVAAFHHLHHGVAVGQVALHDFFALAGRAQVADVGQAHGFRPGLEALAQFAADAAGGAGHQDAFEWFDAHFYPLVKRLT
jgi:hypothetical protein